MYRIRYLNAPTAKSERKRGVSMLYPNNTVLQYLRSSFGRLIHLYGEPDAGRTTVLFHLLQEMSQKDKICGYWIPRKEEFRNDVFQEMVSKKEQCIVGFIPDLKTMHTTLPLAEHMDIICIDNFLEYVLHKKKNEIRNAFATLSATAYKYNTTFILVNDLRYYEAKGGIHPAYQEYFRHFCSRHIEVTKDSNFNIFYTFRQL